MNIKKLIFSLLLLYLISCKAENDIIKVLKTNNIKNCKSISMVLVITPYNCPSLVNAIAIKKQNNPSRVVVYSKVKPYIINYNHLIDINKILQHSTLGIDLPELFLLDSEKIIKRIKVKNSNADSVINIFFDSNLN